MLCSLSWSILVRNSTPSTIWRWLSLENSKTLNIPKRIHQGLLPVIPVELIPATELLSFLFVITTLMRRIAHLSYWADCGPATVVFGVVGFI